MKIAILQFSPRLGDVATSIQRADSILKRDEQAGKLKDLDLLVLPELAFCGYNHPSLSAISPYLEPTAAGPSTEWAKRTARRLRCTVAVGYAENATAEVNFSNNNNTNIDGTDTTLLSHISTRQQHQNTKGLSTKTTPRIDNATNLTDTVAYNSLVFVSCIGDVVAHSRKSHLYYTDETWSQEGQGFYKGIMPVGSVGKMVEAAAGICMDINPYKFEAPWTAYEFANYCREAKVKLVIVSMAWLTRLTHTEVFGSKDDQSIRQKPDMDTVKYWIERMRPLFGVDGTAEETIVVFGNRTGEEGSSPRIGEVRYAGSSCVMGMSKASHDLDINVTISQILGRAEQDLLIVNTDGPPVYTIGKRAS